MTVFEAQNLLFDWFIQNDQIDTSKDLKSVVISLEKPKFDDLALRLALERMVDSDLLSHDKDTTIYVLNKKLNQYSQTIELNGELCCGVAETINKYCEALNVPEEVAFSDNIKEKDIKTLLMIIFLLEKNIKDNTIDK